MIKVMSNVRRIILISLCLLILYILSAIPSFAANVNVSNFSQLKSAINNGDSITITTDITITDELKIPASYSGEIKSQGKILSLAKDVDNMFVIESGANLTFNNIVFDGKEHGRIIDAGESTVTIKNSTLKNATTEPFKQKVVEGKDTQRYEGGAIYAAHTTLKLENSTFEKNHTKSVVPSPGAPHGGAIVSYSANVTITGGVFKDNYTGKVDKQYSSHGEGGAIKLHPGSTLNINNPDITKKDTTVFSGNHLDSSLNEGGRQGGSIEATESKAYIYGTTFQICGPFNTGGAIKFERCNDEADIQNCHFETVVDKGTIGTAGGAITSENSKLSINSSAFKASQGTRVSEAGGLIQVVGSGSFKLNNSTLEGAGASWNAGRYTANTGGAICFYDDSSVTARIENTEIKNFMADGAGAGISLAKSKGHKATVNLTMRDTSIENTACYVWQGNGHGGAMFVGDGNKVTIEGGKISSQTASNNAGAIFNEGNVTITGSDKGPAKVTGNVAYNMVGGIYNDGYLKVDSAEFSNNQKGDWSTGDGHYLKKEEMGGINIYADKDVIITPKAKFDGKDIRVLDGQSKILLTGKLTNKINVSVSEKSKKYSDPKSIFDRYSETQERYIGYTVASGTDGYTATPEDANKIHYVSKDTSQVIAEADDHTSIGKWDYVFNPDDSTIVLGQRAKMIYHANYDDKNAKFKDGSKLKEQIYTFYGSGGVEPKVSIDNKAADYLQDLGEEPVSKWIFDGWYNHNPKQPPVDKSCADFRNTKENDVSESKVNFKDAYFVNTEAKITKIVNPNELHVYAGWKPLGITITKEWDDKDAKNQAKNATLILTPGKDGNNQESFTANRKDLSKTFKNLDKFKEDGVTPLIYKVDEPTVLDGYTKTIVQPDNSKPKEDAISSKVTNAKKDKLYKVVHEFKAADDVAVALPDAIKQRTPANQEDIVDGTKVTPSSFDNAEYDDAVNDGKWKFVSWNKKEDKINGGDVKFIGTWTFTKNETPNPKPKTGSVYVKYVTEDGKVLETESVVIEDAPVGTGYTTEQKTFDGYEFTKMGDGSAKANGNVIEGDLYVTYVYKTKSTPTPEPGPTPTPNPEPTPTPTPDTPGTPKTPENPNTVENQGTNTPKTGDNDFSLYTSILALSLGTALAIRLKKQKNSEEK